MQVVGHHPIHHHNYLCLSILGRSRSNKGPGLKFRTSEIQTAFGVTGDVTATFRLPTSGWDY
jgi:hypothetical protein